LIECIYYVYDNNYEIIADTELYYCTCTGFCFKSSISQFVCLRCSQH